MQFQANSLGEAVPRENFDAVIQSVFDSAANLRLATEDRLITVLLSDHYELPQGIRIAAKGAPLHVLQVGQRAAARGGILRFQDSPLTVDLRGAAVWNCRVRELGVDMSSPSSWAAWSMVWELLNKSQRLHSTQVIAGDLLQANMGSVLSRRMRQPLMQLVDAAEQLDVGMSVQAARQMIGLGPGVTPSGDDILIGFFAALWSLAGEQPLQCAFLHSFGSALIPVAAQTNEISRTYLYHATCGQFSSSLSNLAAALASGSDVEPAARRALRVGHSSGMDSVTGLLVGLRLWNAFAPISPGRTHSVNHYKECL